MVSVNQWFSRGFFPDRRKWLAPDPEYAGDWAARKSSVYIEREITSTKLHQTNQRILCARVSSINWLSHSR
jgi:hypothetical protein